MFCRWEWFQCCSVIRTRGHHYWSVQVHKLQSPGAGLHQEGRGGPLWAAVCVDTARWYVVTGGQLPNHCKNGTFWLHYVYFWFRKLVNGAFVVLLVFCFCTAPERPADIKALPVSNTSVMASWKPPLHSNGILTKYNVYVYNSTSTEVCM